MYKDKRLVSSARTGFYIFLLLLSILAGSFVYMKVIPTDLVKTLAQILIGAIVTIEFLFIQIKESTKRQLDIKAVQDLDKALKRLGETSVKIVTFQNDFVATPLNIPSDFWFNKSLEKYNRVADETMEIRNAYNEFYFALESHEIVVVHLWPLYRYLTFTIDDLLDEIDEINNKFISVAAVYNSTEEIYREAVREFQPLQDKWTELACYMLDFRKILQNDLLGDIYKRELSTREPRVGKTLDQLATEKTVRKMIEARDKKYE